MPRKPWKPSTSPPRQAGVGPRERPVTSRHLLALARAATGGRPARVAYREGVQEVTRREVEVLAVGWRWGQWVALVRRRDGRGLRILELRRVEEVRLVERPGTSRHRGPARGGPSRGSPGGPGPEVDPLEFALADLRDPAAGAARRVTVALPRSLASLAGALFAGAEVEGGPDGVLVHLRATDERVVAAMVASLDPWLG